MEGELCCIGGIMLDALGTTDKSRLRTLIAEAIKEADGALAHFHIYLDYADAVLTTLEGFKPTVGGGADSTLRSIA